MSFWQTGKELCFRKDLNAEEPIPEPTEKLHVREVPRENHPNQRSWEVMVEGVAVCRLNAFFRSAEPTLGVHTEKEFRGYGFAQQAYRHVTATLAREGIAHAWAFCHPDHDASRAVLEKVGFTFDRSVYHFAIGPLRFGAWLDGIRRRFRQRT
jgi:RimJ/RimL family protein N-acetyltransferase